MAKVTVIILTQDEERNLPDLLVSLSGLDAEIFVVDSGSVDRTAQIASEQGCIVTCHPFHNYSAQRNWTLDNLNINTAWVLCLDADERLTPELVRNISNVVTSDCSEFDGFFLKKRTIFMGRWLRWGGQYPSFHLRLFKFGKGRCEEREYDQHFMVTGRVGVLSGDYIDVLTDSLTSWTSRHNHWATLEAREILNGREVAARQVMPRWRGSHPERKRFLRMSVYGHFPLFVRPLLLLIFDYVFRLGFLDGRPGLIFHVLQRFWFRFLIDAKIYEMQRARESDKRE